LFEAITNNEWQIPKTFVLMNEIGFKNFDERAIRNTLSKDRLVLFDVVIH